LNNGDEIKPKQQLMRILHTADWHIGQLFYEFDRTYEHQQFLNWLVSSINEQKVEVLLISGDVFDLSNPSAASVKMFYSFLNEAVKANPHLQIIVTAGNHDSASRLESPKPLLESSNIHIIGLIQRNENGVIDYEKLIIPVKNKDGYVKALCLAVPFLRMGDYPLIDCENPYAEGVAMLYKEAYEYALTKKQAGQAVIAMGHLHTQHAEITDMDKPERLIMGGVECIASTAFHDDINYVALGHIHKAQRIGSKEHIRYCGSPLPMSFSEINYKHQVIVFELDGANVTNLKSIEVPVSVPLRRVPATHGKLSEVLSVLQQLPLVNENTERAPYLEVRILSDGPDPGLRHKIEAALTGKHVRLAKIDVRYVAASTSDNELIISTPDQLNELTPLDVFSRTFQLKYNRPIPEELLTMFNQVAQEVNQAE
jgi:DNA repair protein SbcD/Mre11